MRKALLITTIICGMMAAGTAFSQHTQSLSFIPSGTIFQQNDIFTVETFLTYSGYSAYGFSFWLKTATVGASFSTSLQKSISHPSIMATRGQMSSITVITT